MLAALTELCPAFFLGARTLGSFRQFGILPAFQGVVVSDRYQNYFHDGWQHAGHQACCSHLGLAWHAARERGQPEILPAHPRSADPRVPPRRAGMTGTP
ncbi:MAG: hypothetical protein ACLPKI_26605 [Streptosporangiaceae bacterium]